jgi:hypothetical protein
MQLKCPYLIWGTFVATSNHNCHLESPLLPLCKKDIKVQASTPFRQPGIFYVGFAYIKQSFPFLHLHCLSPVSENTYPWWVLGKINKKVVTANLIPSISKLKKNPGHGESTKSLSVLPECPRICYINRIKTFCGINYKCIYWFSIL